MHDKYIDAKKQSFIVVQKEICQILALFRSTQYYKAFYSPKNSICLIMWEYRKNVKKKKYINISHLSSLFSEGSSFSSLFYGCGNF